MVLVTAFLADLLFGDPRSMPHPVRWTGAMIGWLEGRLYYMPLSKKVSGSVLTLTVVSSAYFLTLLALTVSHLIHPYMEFVVNVWALFTALSVRSLYTESMKVCRSLEAADIHGARENISMIVGRDTENLSSGEVARAAVETVAENIVDGVVSPVFWWIIGGVPFAIAYKAANTLDSMVGYKNSRYMDFGWASARFDDLLNYIPARVSFLLITAAAFISGKDWRRGIITGLRDGRKNPSPNSGIPEAVVAGSLMIELGGINYYDGEPAIKEIIGERVEPLTFRHIRGVNRVMLLAATLTVFAGAFCRWRY